MTFTNETVAQKLGRTPRILACPLERLGDTLLSLAPNYGASDNNGNVRGQTIKAGAVFTHLHGEEPEQDPS